MNARIVFAILCLWFLQPTTGRASEWQPLWNGYDFTGWERFLGRPHPTVTLPGNARADQLRRTEVLGSENDPLGVFTVVTVEGAPAIRISGQVFGSIATRRDHANYHLRLQIKWGPRKWPPRDAWELRDGGLLYHAHSAMNRDGILWPRSLEFQIMERNLGDLYAAGARAIVHAREKAAPNGQWGFDYDPTAEPIAFARGSAAGVRCRRTATVERPFGEWNTLELVCLGAAALHVVNGQVVLRLQDATRLDRDPLEPLTAGRIHLLSEGAELFVREIELRTIAQIPRGFAVP